MKQRFLQTALLLSFGLVASSCASNTKVTDPSMRQPNQVTGDFKKTFDGTELISTADPDIKKYFISQANTPGTAAYKVLSAIRESQSNFGIFPDQSWKLPEKMTEKYFVAQNILVEDYMGKVDGDGNIIDKGYRNATSQILIPVVYRHYGGKMGNYQTLIFTCSSGNEDGSKSQYGCTLTKNVDLP